MRQLKFELKKTKMIFGGADLRSAPKTQRPIDTKSAMHLVLKATQGVLRLPKTIRLVNREIERTAKKYEFKLYRYSNNSNHLHILLRVTNRYRWRAYIRELTGRIAQLTKAKWRGRPFSRIIKGWGRNFKRVKEYVELNIIEALKGLTREQARDFLNLQKEFG